MKRISTFCLAIPLLASLVLTTGCGNNEAYTIDETPPPAMTDEEMKAYEREQEEMSKY